MKILFLALISLLLTLSVVFAADQTDFLSANIDSTVSPKTDFFEYANGAWIRKTPIPASESAWGIGNLVQEELYSRILHINEAAQKTENKSNSTSQKIGDFWTSAMNTQAINADGLNPLKPYLAQIEQLKSYSDLTSIAASFQMDGIRVFFNAMPGQDEKNSNLMDMHFYQGGLGLPNREYYFNTDERTAKIRDQYKKYLNETLIALGMDASQTEARAKEVFELETRLAQSSRKLEELRDPIKNYNKMTLTELSAQSENFDWKQFSKIVGIKDTKMPFVVGQPEFFVNLSKELKTTPIEVWKNYLKFHLVSSFATALDDKTFTSNFNYRKGFTGATEPRPRFKRMIDAEEGAMGELLGQLFVKDYFNPVAKKRYTDLVEAIRTAYVERIHKLSWMSEATKAKALKKLAKVSKKVGYPNKWKDFSSLKIDSHSYFQNILNANRFWYHYEIKKLGKPVDRTEWDMTPQTYNAYYNPSNNEIVLPAGMFTVPGMKDADLDDGFVYGYAAASTIGHEITHGFDDEGRLFDATGNLTDWWSKEDGDEFKKRTRAIVEQFNEFVPVDTLHVNGEATQGENIADLGGMLLGVDAFKKTKQYKEGKLISGFTPMQRFFLGYAYSWMIQEKKEKLANQVMTDVHAPAKQRVNGPVVNVPEFYQAFGIKKGDPMYRDESKRVSIW